MHRSNERLTLSASDVVGALACAHLTALDLGAIAAGGRRPRGDDPMRDVLARRGTEHELAYLAELRQADLHLVEIEDDVTSPDGLTAARDRTLDAMASAADVIYQATFLDDSGDVIWRGHADFLRRIDTPDGHHTYEPEDTKLARHVNPGAVLQLCNYAEHIAAVQGVTCDEIHVVLGNHERVTFRLADFAAYYRSAKAALLAQVANGAPPTYPLPVDHCAVCRWRNDCTARRLADDHLTLVAGLSKRQAVRLEDAGIHTMAALAASDPDLTIRRFAASTLRQLQKQARLQIDARATPGAPPPYELNPPGGIDVGLEALPPPSPGDLFFDIESDPYASDGGLEYLLGIGWVNDDGEFAFDSFWAHSPQEEKQAFEDLIDFIVERQRAHPDLHVYHYAPYEPSALGRLMGRHGTREVEVDNLLRGRVLVDLYRVVRQAMTVGSYSYSIKKLEPLYMEARSAEILDAGSSIVEYERWLQEQDQQILDDLEEYNRDDCHSTQLLRDWLEGVRHEAAAEFGVELARPTPGEAPTDPETDPDEAALLAADLIGGLDDPPTGDDPDAGATWLLAQLLQWHRREQKPEWWAFFHRINDCTPQDLYDDSEAIAGLTYDGVVDTIKRSEIHRYRFDPDQDYKLGVGDTVHDPETEHLKATGEKRKGPGTLLAIDEIAGTLDLKRGTGSDAPHPEALIPGGPINVDAMRGSLLRLGRSVLGRGIDGDGIGRAARDLLLRRPPRVAGIVPGAPLVEGAPGIAELTDLAMRLDHSYLAVQGPPGTGKTYTAARSIVALIDAGKRVGITANSHAVITNLLDEVLDAAAEGGVKIRALQRCGEDKGSQRDDVTCVGDNATIEGALAEREVDLVAGTAWLFAREAMADTLDHLVIDEAGQLSLANVVAVAGAADNLILVGDPQQLAQPSKGSHPLGAEASGLEHILAGAPTVPADRGLFLETSWRMHPGVCALVSEISYESRLHSLPACGQLHVEGDDELSGAGLRWLPVPHTDNKTSSAEEAAAIADAIDRLVGRTWTDRAGHQAALTLDDIIVVAPYNAQVGALRAALPEGTRVGTVDKFQGQEGAVAIVSLAASSADEAPRGLEFLLSRNRMNVAVSRAKALAIVVGSPELPAARCRSVEQMRLANGLCRYVELATTGSSAS